MPTGLLGAPGSVLWVLRVFRVLVVGLARGAIVARSIPSRWLCSMMLVNLGWPQVLHVAAINKLQVLEIIRPYTTLYVWYIDMWLFHGAVLCDV